MQGRSNPQTSGEEKAKALEKVLASDEFRGADRLREFLDYIVREEIEGRGDKILGKSIIQDVYGRRSRRDTSTANVVRVDAGRLRRRLGAYYAAEGAQDDVRIHVDTGGYVPRFERLPEDAAEVKEKPVAKPQHQDPKRSRTGVLVGGAIAVAAVSAWLVWPEEADKSALTEVLDRVSDQEVARGVLFETDPVALQAINLAHEARRLLFPATQATRLRAALILFEEAISLDDGYFGGYAGAAQAAAMFGGLAPAGTMRDEMLRKARLYGDEAVSLDPTKAWSNSALAFVNMVERNFEEANRLSKRAVSLDPDDLITLEIDAIIALFSGDFDRALSNAAPQRHDGREGSRFPWRNVYGNASFYVGNYQESISVLYRAAANGDPVSEISTAHLIASLQASGRDRDARRHVAEYLKAWPDSRLEELMFRLFANPEHPEKLISTLRQAGWPD